MKILHRPLTLIIAVLAISFVGSSSTAQPPRFSLTCAAAPPDDCIEFQDYWDSATMGNFYDCAFPRQAKQCWDPRVYVIKQCKESPVGLNFIDAHDTVSGLFRIAYAAGDFSNAPQIMYVWEDLNATLMDPPFALTYKSQIEADISKLKIPDAIAFAAIAAKHTSDFNSLLKVLSPIAINLLACTDIEKQIPGFVRKVLGHIMTLGGVWFVEGPADGDPITNQILYDGSTDLHIVVHRDDCASAAFRPSVLVQGQRADGHTFSEKLDVGQNVDVVGKNIAFVLIKATKNWTRYECASGSLSIKN